MKINYLLLILMSFLFFASCQKEASFESGTSPSAGLLQDDASGNCLPKNVNGVYVKGTALVPDSNYIDVQVNVTKAGSYTVYTDTVNGVYFRTTGTFANTGVATVRLKAIGTPVNDGISNFTVTYTTSSCIVPVTVLPAGGAVDAVFTLDGSPNDCINYVLSGTYVAGTAMTPSNTVAINVNVATAGTYSITTATSNGFSFTGTGTLSAGAQIITLTATGVPVAAGNTNFPITAGASSCNFAVVVTDVVAATDYFPLTAGSNWSYEFDGDANDSLYIRSKPGTVNIDGNAYTIFEATADAAGGYGDYGAYRKSGSDYHTYLDLADYFALDSSATLDYIFLKDNSPVNTTWQSAPVNVKIGGQDLTLRIVLTIEQKDVPVTVGGVDYPNTIVVREKYELMTGPIWTDITDQVGYFRSYYAKGVGLIKQDYYYDPGNANPTMIDTRMDLRRYAIIP